MGRIRWPVDSTEADGLIVPLGVAKVTVVFELRPPVPSCAFRGGVGPINNRHCRCQVGLACPPTGQPAANFGRSPSSCKIVEQPASSPLGRPIGPGGWCLARRRRAERPDRPHCRPHVQRSSSRSCESCPTCDIPNTSGWCGSELETPKNWPPAGRRLSPGGPSAGR